MNECYEVTGSQVETPEEKLAREKREERRAFLNMFDTSLESLKAQNEALLREYWARRNAK